MIVRNLVIKKNPLSRAKEFAFFEILSVIFVITIAAYLEFVNKTIYSQITDYILFEVVEVTVILLLTMTNFIIQLYLWTRSTYKIIDGKLISVTRFRERIIKITPDMRLISQIGPVGRYLDYGNIIIHRHGVKVFEFKDIVDPSLNYVLISEIVSPKLKPNFLDNLFKQYPDDFISSGETQYVEYKATLGWDIKRGVTNKEMQKSVLKTLAAFMNSNGGVLLIGISDSKEIIGIEYDINSLKRKDIDGFQNFLTMLFSDEIGAENFTNIAISFEKRKDKTICLIKVRPSKSPIYVKNGNGEEFFIRVGNSTHALSIKAATEYINSHFKSK